MKKATIYLFMIFAMVATAFAAPTVTVTSPTNGTVFTTKSVAFSYSILPDSNDTTCTYSSAPSGTPGYSETGINVTGTFGTFISKNFTTAYSGDNYNVSWTLTCSNFTGATTSTSGIFTIREVPVFTSSPSTTATRNQPYSYQVTATDSDGIVPYTSASLITAPAGMTISLTGLISWTPTSVGKYTVTVRTRDNAGLTTDQTFTIEVKTDSKLRIKSINLDLSGDDNILTSNFQEVLDTDVIMGESMAIYVDMCNDQENGQDIKNAEVEVTIKDLDGGDDIGGTISRFTLDGNTCDEKKVKLDVDKIPYTADYKRYEVRVDLKGRNESNGVSMSDFWTVYFTVFKDSDPNIKITSFGAFPTEISCDRTFSLDVKGVNIGDNDDNVVLRMESTALRINEVREFEMGDNPDDDCNALNEPEEGCFLFDGSFTYSVSPNLAAGLYPITVYTYRDTSRQTDKQTINLKVSACVVDGPTRPTTPTEPAAPTTPTTPTEPRKEEPIVVVQPTTPVTPTTTPIRIVERKSLAESNYYTVLLVLGNVGLLALIVFVLSQAMRKR